MGFEAPRPTYRIGWAIETCWMLASMAFAVILMSSEPDGLLPISEDVVVVMHDSYYVLSGLEFGLYHLLWVWAWVNVVRLMITRMKVRRVYLFFIIAVSAHLLHLGYFLFEVLPLLPLAAAVHTTGDIIVALAAYFGTGFAFWSAVLITGVVRWGAKYPDGQTDVNGR